MKYRKKPIVIEAMVVPSVFDIDGRIAFEEWLKPKCLDRSAKWTGANLLIDTLEGKMLAEPGDWVICGVKGELYPCKPDIFEATYEVAE